MFYVLVVIRILSLVANRYFKPYSVVFDGFDMSALVDDCYMLDAMVILFGEVDW